MEFDIMLLNIVSGKTSLGNNYYALGYIFLGDDFISDNDKFKGVSENRVFVNSDITKYLDVTSIFKKFKLVGDLVSDYRNPLNQIFKPTKLIDVKANYEISLSDKKPE